jgi:transmembrane sensor
MDHSNFNIEDLITDESFVNYCYGLDKADIQFWENKISANPAQKETIEKAKELCLLLAIKVSPAEKQIQLKKLQHEIEALENEEPVKEKAYGKIKQLWVWASVAASLLILTTVYVSHRISQSTNAPALYSAITATNYHLTAATDFDHRKTVVLPDGSTVILNGSSTLKIAADYNVNYRHVLLTGEAFFYVKKNHAKPFVVLTAKTATTALGTSFKVQSYPSESVASVMLATGKVKVESTRTNDINEVILTPGQQAVLRNNNIAFEKSAFDNSSIQNWLNRKLVFSNADLDNIVLKFKEIYGINIIASNISPDKVMFTGQFNDKNPTEVLDAIGFSNHFTYKQNGNTVTLVF